MGGVSASALHNLVVGPMVVDHLCPRSLHGRRPHDWLRGSCARVGHSGRGWPAEGQARRRVVTVTTLVGVSYTIFSEWLNVEVRQTWAYTELMPRLPPLDVGLMPVLQWLTCQGWRSGS